MSVKSQYPTLSIDDVKDLTTTFTSGSGTDTLQWGTGTTMMPSISISDLTTTTGTGQYVYTSPNTVPWITTTTGTSPPSLNVKQGGTIELQGDRADIKINDKSMVAWMEKVEERLNMLTPNPELEKDWDDLRRLGERYRKLEKRCQEKAQMWTELKKVQPNRL